MSRRLASIVLPLGLALVAGCATSLETPPLPYGYRPVVTPDGETLLLPRRCAAWGTSEPPVALPPGCASALNLLEMVERQDDLRVGRATGPAFAAPVGRAAHRYLQGDELQQRQRERDQDAQATTRGQP